MIAVHARHAAVIAGDQRCSQEGGRSKIVVIIIPEADSKRVRSVALSPRFALKGPPRLVLQE
jgi:hypothetical protein